MKTLSQKHAALLSNDYAIGKRDPAVKPDHAGSFMVADSLDPDGYSIVGNDLEALILEAFSFLEDGWNRSSFGSTETPSQAIGAYIVQD